MPTVMLYFIMFALSLTVLAEYARPYAPLLAPAMVCPTCGRRGWRSAT